MKIFKSFCIINVLSGIRWKFYRAKCVSQIVKNSGTSYFVASVTSFVSFCDVMYLLYVQVIPKFIALLERNRRW